MKQGLERHPQVAVFSEPSLWLSKVVLSLLDDQDKNVVNLSGSVSIRDSWDRLKDAERLIVHWENAALPGGYLIEQVLELDPKYPLADRVIVLTSEPVVQDIRYLGELGIRRIVRIRQRSKEIAAAGQELINHLKGPFSPLPDEINWVKLQQYVDHLTSPPNQKVVQQIKLAAEKLSQKGRTARFFDLMAGVAAKLGRLQLAKKYYLQALDLNPNFFRSLQGLSQVYEGLGEFDSALEICRSCMLK